MTVPPDPLQLQSKAFEEGAQRGADYLRTLSGRQVNARTEKRSAFDMPLPHAGLAASQVLKLLDDAGRDGTMATAAGRYFGYVIGGALPAASGARAMLSAWDQVADVLTGPSVLALEKQALSWVIDLLDLPGETEGVFTTGASIANMALIATARDTLLERAGHPRGRGLIGAPKLRIVASAEIHATVLKSLRMTGLGSDCVERVAVDSQGRMRAQCMPALDARTLVLAQAGNVCTGASDPINDIAELCEQAGAWLHVDGAFGLWARAVAPLNQTMSGLERADSWVVDAHKTLNAPYDSGIALCRHPEEMRASMAMGASYLPPTTPSPADLAPEFSRAARGAETWAALLSLGRDGLQDLLTRLHRHAARVARELKLLGFEVPHDIHFNQVFATLPGKDEKIASIVNHVQASGEAWFAGANWQGKTGFRISVSNWATCDDDIDRLIAAIKRGLLEAG
ncbi:MAG: aspartate aminotransferase family protein [Rhizobiales bacterium]|nr:aspartate aminotransferase family protein [Hyphomicrobiales bacterium]